MSDTLEMTTSYLPYAPGQSHLLPPSVEEWLPEGHLAYFIGDTVDSLDLSAFHARYAKGGPRNQPFHPAMMVKVLLYGYATGVFSSRKQARRLYDDVAFRVLAAGNFPAHRTLSDFRALRLEELSSLFAQVVRLARECGLVKLGTIAVDGTKVKANASRHKAMSYGRMQPAEAELKAQIAALLERARTTDAAEAGEPESDLPAEIARREARLAAIAAAKARLEAQQREADTARGRHPDDDGRPRRPDGTPKKGKSYARDFGVPADTDQSNFTDPQSRIMKQSNGGFDYSYNAQTAVDDAHQIIVAAELTDCASDSGQLPVVLAAVEHTLGELPAQSLADTGYRSEAVFAALSQRPCQLVVALGREGRELAKIDSDRYPHTARMAQYLSTEEGKATPPPQGYRGSTQRLDQGGAGVPAIQSARYREGACRVETRLHGVEPAADGGSMNANEECSSPIDIPAHLRKGRSARTATSTPSLVPTKPLSKTQACTASPVDSFCRAGSTLALITPVQQTPR